jgi:hypothetical protein
MFEDADKFLKIAAGLGILAAGLGVGYHYAIYIPQHERERIAADEKRERERIAADEKRERDRIAAAEKAEKDKQISAKSEFAICKSSAWSDYKINWDAACKINGMDKQSPGCSLPSWMADKQNQSLHDAENMCLEIYKEKIN